MPVTRCPACQSSPAEYPDAKTPAPVDGDAVVFDSAAILLYLAEKTGQFLPIT